VKETTQLAADLAQARNLRLGERSALA